MALQEPLHNDVSLCRKAAFLVNLVVFGEIANLGKFAFCGKVTLLSKVAQQVAILGKITLLGTDAVLRKLAWQRRRPWQSQPACQTHPLQQGCPSSTAFGEIALLSKGALHGTVTLVSLLGKIAHLGKVTQQSCLPW